MIGIASAGVLARSTLSATPSRWSAGIVPRRFLEFHRQADLRPGVSRPVAVSLRRVGPVGVAGFGVDQHRVGRHRGFGRAAFLAFEEVDAERAGVERVVERAGVELERHLAAHFEGFRHRVGDPAVDLRLGIGRAGRVVVAAAGVVAADLHALVGVGRRLEVEVVGVVVQAGQRFVFRVGVGRAGRASSASGAPSLALPVCGPLAQVPSVLWSRWSLVISCRTVVPPGAQAVSVRKNCCAVTSLPLPPPLFSFSFSSSSCSFSSSSFSSGVGSASSGGAVTADWTST